MPATAQNIAECVRKLAVVVPPPLNLSRVFSAMGLVSFIL